MSFDELALTLLSINQKPLVSNIKFFLREALKAISGSAVEPAGSQLDPCTLHTLSPSLFLLGSTGRKVCSCVVSLVR